MNSIDRAYLDSKRVKELEDMIRDLCIDHADDCQCRYCKAVFRPVCARCKSPDHHVSDCPK